jgi:hypothetical protein
MMFAKKVGEIKTKHLSKKTHLARVLASFKLNAVAER